MQLLIQPRSTHRIAPQILSILQRFGGASCQTSAPWPWQWVLERPKVSTISCEDNESLQLFFLHLITMLNCDSFDS